MDQNSLKQSSVADFVHTRIAVGISHCLAIGKQKGVDLNCN